MRYLSVCSGIEAASVAWHPLGWEPVAFSEVDAFPSAVLAHHYPQVPNWGDMTKFQEWPDATVDLLVGGTPCQSFSVAGLRGGLDDPRGSLMLVYLALARRYRPRWLVWENVPGVLSSNDGRDFGSLLGGLAELGYGFAYRVLDAQYFGLAQRRKRVFVVASAGGWQRAAAVLFERASLSGHPAPRREAGQGVAPTVGSGAPFSRTGNERSELDAYVLPDVAPTVPARRTRSGRLLGGIDYENNAHGPDEPTGPPLKGSPTGGGRPLPAIGLEVAPTLDATMGRKWGSNQWVNQGHAIVCMGSGQANAEIQTDGLGPTLTCLHEAPIVAHALRAEGFDAGEDGTGRGTPLVPVAFDTYNQRVTGDTAQTLCSRGDTPGGNAHLVPAVMQSMAVRRLTPRECERLQGFPDDYTLVPYRGKPAADGPRYKALGNSMAVPVMRWIGQRIQQVEDILRDNEAVA